MRASIILGVGIAMGWLACGGDAAGGADAPADALTIVSLDASVEDARTSVEDASTSTSVEDASTSTSTSVEDASTSVEDASTSTSVEDASTSPDADVASWTRPPRPDTDHPGAHASWRWGGGAGYPDTVDPTWPIVTRVADLASLTTALGAARPGDVVWVEGGAAIDLTGQPLCVPTGVTLASDRGQGGAQGALLFATAGASAPVIAACGADVRVTGLRIRGPDPETCPPEWPAHARTT